MTVYVCGGHKSYLRRSARRSIVRQLRDRLRTCSSLEAELQPPGIVCSRGCNPTSKADDIIISEALTFRYIHHPSSISRDDRSQNTVFYSQFVIYRMKDDR